MELISMDTNVRLTRSGGSEAAIVSHTEPRSHREQGSLKMVFLNRAFGTIFLCKIIYRFAFRRLGV
jgi:hypothetical protein